MLWAFCAKNYHRRICIEPFLLGWENLDNPDFGDLKADLFYCGDEAGRATLDQIISDLGLDPVYLGGVEQVDLVEGMTDMWFNLALRQKMGRRIAFKLLK